MARENSHRQQAEQDYLGNIAVEAQREIRLYFATDTKTKMIKMEKYIFDFDLKFKPPKKETYDKPRALKTKHRWLIDMSTK